MQKKVIVIGGGFAGLTASSYLVKNNFKVTLLEASPKLGGRAYSFADKETSTIIDNGQHILMGCYYETLKFLDLIGAGANFHFQKKLEVNFIKENFKPLPLKAISLFYPFNLLIGLLYFKAIHFSQRLNLLKLLAKLPFINPADYNEINIRQWLESENQSPEVSESFWKILAVGALNTSPEKASAGIFIDILKKIFLNGNKASAIILPKYGLSESYCNNAEVFIKKNGGKINLSETVTGLTIKDGAITEVQTMADSYRDFDYVISAVPAYALSKVLDENFEREIPDFTYSSILNINLWHKHNNFPAGFFGLINSPVHWVFNKGSHLNLVISVADEFRFKSDEDIIAMVKVELKKFFRLQPEVITNHKIIKEKRATFIPSGDVLHKRPSQKTWIRNLFLAGDWVDTGLPSTIESAVKSGRVAAEIIFDLK
jgi:squalene-associated FAD-dependent desaturase